MALSCQPDKLAPSNAIKIFKNHLYLIFIKYAIVDICIGMEKVRYKFLI